MSAHYRISRLGLYVLLRILFSLIVSGHRFIPPRGGAIFAANHISLADPLVIGAAVPRELHFLAKRELFKRRLFARLITTFHAIPIHRFGVDREAINRATVLLRKGHSLLLFPEGTRSRDGNLKRGKGGVGLLALAAMVPIVPTYVENSDHLGHALLRRGRLSVRFGPPIERGWLGAVQTKRAGYRAVTEEVMNRIRMLKESEGSSSVSV